MGEVVAVPTPILTLDQDALFAGSAFGTRVAAELESRSRALAAENRRIETDLTDEEQALTDARPDLTPAEFRDKADAFDTKVQLIRAEQAAKARDLTTFRDAEQQRFATLIGPILAGLVRERGAVAVLERRTLLLSLDAIDITAETIAALDDQIGDGALPQPEQPPEPAPEPAPDHLQDDGN